MKNEARSDFITTLNIENWHFFQIASGDGMKIEILLFKILEAQSEWNSFFLKSLGHSQKQISFFKVP